MHTMLGNEIFEFVDFSAEAADVKGEVKAKIKISPVVVFGVLNPMVLVRES